MKRTFKSFVNLYEALDNNLLSNINDAITSIGPDIELFIVGGAVRDHMLGIESKDIDFVVTKMPMSDPDQALDAIYKVLHPMVQGKVNKVGESFGIVTATIEGEDFDFAIPRRGETKTGDGHADVSVDLDPTASIESDLGRRDFTVNAIAQRQDGTLVDPFNGRSDIDNGMIRAVGNAHDRFKEDPLRMLRAFQFASRLSTTGGQPFSIADDTMDAISDLGHLIKQSISGDRILKEFEKAWTKGRSNVDTLIKLLKTSGVGEDMFGSKFNPVPVDIKGDAKEMNTARFVGMFLNGGEKEFIGIHKGLPINYLTYLKLMRKIIKGDLEPQEIINNDKSRIPLLLKIAEGLKNAVGSDPAAYVRKMGEVAIIPRDLAFNGGDFMQHGVEGTDIGIFQKEILSAIWSGKLNNTKEDILRFITDKET
jgi:tRNA nucleotidyltransferase/poly(A) polymerase